MRTPQFASLVDQFLSDPKLRTKAMYVKAQPGVGKSQIIQDRATAAGLEVADIRLGQLDAVDLGGLPFPVYDGEPGKSTARMARAITDLLPHDPDWQGVVFFDELSQAPAMVQGAALQLLLDGKLGQYTLPAGARKIGAGNRTHDRAGAQKLISPLVSRFVTSVTLECNPDDWLEWSNGKVSDRVRGYIKNRPDHLNTFDPTDEQQADGHPYACPRTWDFAGDIIDSGLSEDLYQEVLGGCVGAGVALDFVAYLKYYDRLPDVDADLARMDGVLPPEEPSLQYAYAMTLLSKSRAAHMDNDGGRVADCCRLASRMQTEPSITFFRDLMQSTDKMTVAKIMTTDPEVLEWSRENSKFVLSN